MLPMLEREKMLLQLQEAAGISRAGSGRIVLVEGEAGIGKTRLVSEFIATLGDDCVAATGYCERLCDAHPLSALYDIAGQMAGAFKTIAPGCADPAAALIEAVRASENCSVLVFEDVQWADPETLDLLRFVCRRIDKLRALVVVTYRDDEIGPSHPFALALGDCPSHLATHLPLKRLSLDAVNQLAPSQGRCGKDIHALSGGNPFLATELLRQPIDPGDTDEIPMSIRQAVAARLAPLEPATRRWLELLCVFPEGLDRAGLQLLGKAMGMNAAEVPGWNGLLIERPDGTVSFRHEAARLAVRAMIAADHRQKIKADALAALAAEPGFVSEHILLLEKLADNAGQPEAAIRFARQGAAAAIAEHRYGDAAELLEIVLPLAAAQDSRLHARLVGDWAELALATTGLNDDAVAALRRCGTVWRRLDCRSELSRFCILMARVRRELGLFDPYPAEKAEIIAAARQHDDGSVRAHALVIAAHDELDACNLSEGRQLAIAAIREARLAGDRIARLNGWLALAQARHRLGLGGDVGLAQACAKVAARDGLNMLSSAIAACRFDEALNARDLAMADRCLVSTPHNEVPPCWQGGIAGRLALLRVMQGQIAEGEALAGTVLRDDNVRPGMRFHAALAMALARMRRLGRGAGDWLAEAERLASAASSCRDVVQVKTAAIELAFLSGDYLEASDHCIVAAECSVAPVGEALVEETLLWQARLGLDGSETAPALASDPPELADALMQRGLPFEAALSRLMAAGDNATTDFGQAITEFEAIGADAGVALARRLASEHAINVQMPVRRRGPYRAARHHPLGLTRREVQILRMIVNGDSNKEIAGKLGRSLRTVEHHVSAILGKMGTENRIQAVIHAIAKPEILDSIGDNA